MFKKIRNLGSYEFTSSSWKNAAINFVYTVITNAVSAVLIMALAFALYSVAVKI